MFSYFQKQFTNYKPENVATVLEINGERYSREKEGDLVGHVGQERYFVIPEGSDTGLRV